MDTRLENAISQAEKSIKESNARIAINGEIIRLINELKYDKIPEDVALSSSFGELQIKCSTMKDIKKIKRAIREIIPSIRYELTGIYPCHGSKEGLAVWIGSNKKYIKVYLRAPIEEFPKSLNKSSGCGFKKVVIPKQVTEERTEYQYVCDEKDNDGMPF